LTIKSKLIDILLST